MPTRKASRAVFVVLKIMFVAVIFTNGVLAVGQTETILYNFGQDASFNAAFPSGRLVFDSWGALYSEAQGGAYGNGVILKLAPPGVTGGPWVGSLLYSFKGIGNGPVDGAGPMGGLLVDDAGGLDGVTSKGGVSSRGTVFSLAPPAVSGGSWTESVLHLFGGAQNGMGPSSALLRVKGGALYGTTQSGGSSGAGTIFRLTPPAAGQTGWTEKILYSFTGGTDGGTPSGELILDKFGTLYGTTNKGGLGFGTVFKLTRPVIAGGLWTETVLYSFTGGSDGANPLGGLILDSTGSLYGTSSGVYVGAKSCSSGTPGACGTVFKLIPPSVQGGAWMYNEIYSFAGVLDGADPITTLTRAKDGTLYGTTYLGGLSTGIGNGTLFKLIPPGAQGDAWTEIVLHRFVEIDKDGAFPDATLILNAGTLFGTTTAGGSTNAGTLFELVP